MQYSCGAFAISCRLHCWVECFITRHKYMTDIHMVDLVYVYVLAPFILDLYATHEPNMHVILLHNRSISPSAMLNFTFQS